MGRQQQRAGIGRRELAEQLELHQDSLSRLMPDGLASAVIAWGGAGKPMTFSVEHALRFHRAYSCTRDRGGPCAQCRRVLEDCRNIAEHLIDARHAFGGCALCRTPWPLVQPCPTPPRRMSGFLSTRSRGRAGEVVESVAAPVANEVQ
jgi:hypothetical protein